MSPDLTLAARAVDADWANFALGNEVFDRPGGRFVRNLDYPGIYDANHVAHITASTPEEIDALLAHVEVEFAAVTHRRFETDFRTPPQFLARLALEGYKREEALVMVLDGAPGGSPPAVDIRPVATAADWAALAELHKLDWMEARERNRQDPLEHIETQMFAVKRLKQPPVQYWLAWEDGRAVAFLNSWGGDNGFGQVEDLFTHPDFRNRGIATALIHQCVADCRTKGAGPVVIVADPADTPKHLYHRLGFQPVAVVGHYLKEAAP